MSNQSAMMFKYRLATVRRVRESIPEMSSEFNADQIAALDKVKHIRDSVASGRMSMDMGFRALKMLRTSLIFLNEITNRRKLELVHEYLGLSERVRVRAHGMTFRLCWPCPDTAAHKKACWDRGRAGHLKLPNMLNYIFYYSQPGRQDRETASHGAPPYTPVPVRMSTPLNGNTPPSLLNTAVSTVSIIPVAAGVTATAIHLGKIGNSENSSVQPQLGTTRSPLFVCSIANLLTTDEHPVLALQSMYRHPAGVWNTAVRSEHPLTANCTNDNNDKTPFAGGEARVENQQCMQNRGLRREPESIRADLGRTGGDLAAASILNSLHAQQQIPSTALHGRLSAFMMATARHSVEHSEH